MRCSAVPLSIGKVSKHWKGSGGCSRSSLWRSWLSSVNDVGAGSGMKALGWSCQWCCITLSPYPFGEEKRKHTPVQKIRTTWGLADM